ncbi:MAG: AAA family ATPase [Deltaproteobacteria bacterium]|nr:AAA family ATPase [Deltaproteobacteria bacterium]
MKYKDIVEFVKEKTVVINQADHPQNKKKEELEGQGIHMESDFYISPKEMKEKYSAINYYEAPPLNREWLLKGFLPSNEIALVCAPGGTGKGFFCRQMGMRLAGGIDFFGFMPTRPFRTLYLTTEESEIDLQETINYEADLIEDPEIRKLTLENFYAKCVKINPMLIVTSGAPGWAFDEAQIELLIKTIIDNKIEVLILDTLSRIFPVTENDNASASVVCNMFNEIMAKTGCTIIITHHFTKEGGGSIAYQISKGRLEKESLLATEKRVSHALKESHVRGASAWVYSARAVITLMPFDADVAINYFDDREAQNGQYIAARLSKINNAPYESKVIKYFKHFQPEDRKCPGGFLVEVVAKGLLRAKEEANLKGTKPLSEAELKKLEKENKALKVDKENSKKIGALIEQWKEEGCDMNKAVTLTLTERLKPLLKMTSPGTYAKAVAFGLEKGLFVKIDNPKKQGEILILKRDEEKFKEEVIINRKSI